MDISTSLSTIAQQLQFVSLWRSIQWPPAVTAVLDRINYFNFNPLYVLNVNNLPVIDFRVLFVAVGVLLPILIVILSLLLFSTALVTVVYLSFVSGLSLILAFVIGAILRSPQSSGLLFAGIALVASAAVFEVFRRCYRSTSGNEPEEEWYTKFHRRCAFRQFLAAFVFLMAGFIFLQVIPLGISFDFIGRVVTIIIGAVCVGFGGLAGIYFLINLTPGGRRLVRWLVLWVRHYGATILFSLTTLTFVPCCSYCVTVFLCRDYSCAAGSSFNPYASRPTGTYDTGEAIFCNPCTALNVECARRAPVDVCPARTYHRNVIYPDIPCDDASAVYYYVASVIVLGSFVLGVPVLFFFAIRTVTREVQQRIKVSERANLQPDEVWSQKVTCEETAAAALYSHYRYPSRYFFLVQLALNISVSLLSVIVPSFSLLGSTVAVGAVYLAYAIIIAATKPYRYKLELILACFVAAVNVTNAVLGIISTTVDVDRELSVIFLVLNALPFVAVVIIFIISRLDTRRQQSKYKADCKVDGELSGENEAARRKIDEKVARQFSNGLMVMGVALFLALSSCIVVLQLEAPRPFRISTDPTQQTLFFQTAGFPRWEDMTAACCCLNSVHSSADFSVEEQWLCNGTSLFRGRVSTDGNDDGRLLRDVCSSTPSNPDLCSFEVSNDRLSLRCLSSYKESIVPSNISQFAYEFLF